MGVKVREVDGKGWYVFINWRNQRKAKSFGADKATAKEFAKKLSARLKWAEVSGEPLVLSQPDQQMPTVKGYMSEWLQTYAKVHCKPSTYRGYERAIHQHLIPAFGDKPLHELKREHVKRLIAEQMNSQKARNTIQNYLVPLKAAYNQAKQDGLVVLNPAERLGKLLQRPQDRRQEMQPLTAQEVEMLLSVAEAHHPALYPVLLCAVRTGLRQGELIGLQWGDIDFRGQFMDVRRGVVLGEVTTTKSKKIRRVDLSPTVVTILRREKEIRQLQAMNAGQDISPWVFLSPQGQRWDERNLRRSFYRCLDKAGIRQVRFHDLRHTYASLMAEAGAPPKYVQKQLGHSSFQVTMDVYSHLFPDGSREWVTKLDMPAGPMPLHRESAVGSV
jgi:integrase